MPFRPAFQSSPFLRGDSTSTSTLPVASLVAVCTQAPRASVAARQSESLRMWFLRFGGIAVARMFALVAALGQTAGARSAPAEEIARREPPTRMRTDACGRIRRRAATDARD